MAEPFTVGMIGAGAIAGAHLPAWLSLGVRVLVYTKDDPSPLLNRVGGGEAVGSLDELLASVDAVDVCTPTTTHAELVRAAAAAGRDVLCEKPFALSSADAESMITACADAGVQLYPAHVVRYFSEYVTMHDAVAAGKIGEIAVQRFTRAGSRPLRPWYLDDALSGGLVVDQSIHDLDFARWNAGEVATVFARDTGADPAVPVRSTQVILTHTNGAISYVNGTWARPGTTFRTTFQIAGTGGLLQHDSTEHRPLVIDGGATDDSGTGLLPDAGFTESPYLTEIREFHAAFTTGAPTRVSAADGLAAVKIAEAAATSIRTGQPVHLSNDSAAVAEEAAR
ncbi:Gfo/Idh/MocA family protein [Microlunatus parietis]|uniref:Myo-inositol 2-dehydrogenase/D-chiro-inositol 1-dehydrogenase n=1 Tax=Microlunatus parietis TaxID=682979 RepID=A0A7Y9ICG8_9ACTN|nr:Gfo/Idh/MocA family oxidoreductase [Microlunatus parietis]NYE74061.1 myo-inositol 2-dehydrogenase/D-chiro-inositol 1-dehydrogenase [Microlunatus parietis]